MLSALGKKALTVLPMKCKLILLNEPFFSCCAVWHFQNEEACPTAVYLCDIFRIDLFPEGTWEYVLKKYEGSQAERGQ